MKAIVFIIYTLGISTLFVQCKSVNSFSSKEEINTVLNAWHKAAAEANFDAYFNIMTPNSHFIGTDATENWGYEDFKAYAKPHFDKGSAWAFTTLERTIFIAPKKELAWFDEHLDTQMGICRGSGVLKKVNGQWKIAHYVLSIAVPNEHVRSLTTLKKEWDEAHIKNLTKN